VDVQACLNGNRSPDDHPAVPLTPEEIAEEAAAAVEEGAQSLHVHPRDGSGLESLDPGPCDAVVAVLRAACPGIPVGLTTGAWIEPDPHRRLELVRSWTEPPDFVSVNFSEGGTSELCALLLERGIGIEAGLWRVEDVHALAESGLADRCLRVLVEAIDEDVESALANAQAMNEALDAVGVTVPRLQHGMDIPAWAVLRDAVARGHDVRIGLEDTFVLPDDMTAADTAEMVAGAVEIAQS
jgi:uncharacterized protein (DUF849 family)